MIKFGPSGNSESFLSENINRRSTPQSGVKIGGLIGTSIRSVGGLRSARQKQRRSVRHSKPRMSGSAFTLRIL